jgi:hypothetical protein
MRSGAPSQSFVILTTPCLVILSEVIGPRSGAITQSKDPYPISNPDGATRHFHPGTILIPPHDNPVITQNFNILALSPEPRSRALPRPRMPDEKISDTIRADDAGPVQFNRFLLREAVHDEEFVERIAERSPYPGKNFLAYCIQLQSSTRKRGVNQ